MRQTENIQLEKEQRILDAAQRRFAAFGLNKVTMDEIAADLGMGKASLYYYFPNKEELIRSVMLRELASFSGRIKELRSAGLPPPDQLRQYAERRLEFFATLLNLHLLELHQTLLARPVFREVFQTLATEEEQQLAGILREGMEKGAFAPMDVRRTAQLVLHVMQGLGLRLVRMAQFQTELAPHRKALAQETRLFIELLLAGLCAPAGAH